MRYLYTYVIAALVTTAKAEATQVSIHRKIHKQNMAHPYNEVLFSLKMEGNADSGYSMEEPWGIMLTETDQSQKHKHCTSPLIWGT